MKPTRVDIAIVVAVATMAFAAVGAQSPLPAWPAPDAPARVQFTRSISPASQHRPSVLARIARLIAGSGDKPVMEQPHGAALGPDGRLYVVDGAAHVVHAFGPEAGEYRAIHVDSESLIGITFIGERMIVTDSIGGRVICLDQRGRVQWSRGRGDGFEWPTGIASAGDRAFVVDTIRGRVVPISARGVIGRVFGQRGKGAGEMNFPTHIAANGRELFVNDTLNFRVQVFDLDGRFLRAFGQLGDGPGDFDKPKGVAVDASDRIYVVDGLHDVVKVFDHDGRPLIVFGASGHGPGELWLPAGIAVAGPTIFVVDSANRRVQVYERLGDAR